MSQNINLVETLDLLGAFKDALEHNIQGYPNSQKLIQENLRPGETEEVIELMQDIMARTMPCAFDEEALNRLKQDPEYQEQGLKFLEKSFDIAARAIPMDFIIQSRPEGLDNQENTDYFRSKGYEALAKVCGYTPSV